MEGGKDEILLNVLHRAQEKHGYLSESVLKKISSKYSIPIAKLYGVVKFYTMFHTEPQGKNIIEICGSPSCVLNNGISLEQFLKSELKIKIGETTQDKLFSLYKTSCIGCCDEAPAMLLNRKPCTRLTIDSLKATIENLRKEAGEKKE